MYRVHDITVSCEDYSEVLGIIDEHFRLGDIDNLIVIDGMSSGRHIVTFAIYPYVYADFEKIWAEIVQAGIQIL